LIDSFKDSKGMNLVLEYAAGGTLDAFMNTHRSHNGDEWWNDPWTTTKPISQVNAIRIMRELAEGLIQIHGRNITHGDIHEQNILLKGNPEEWKGNNPLVKYTDFGFPPKYADINWINRVDKMDKMEIDDVGDDVENVFNLMKEVASITYDGAALAKLMDQHYKEDLLSIVNVLEDKVNEDGGDSK
jgi:serine/threonine protein kinase